MAAASAAGVARYEIIERWASAAIIARAANGEEIG